MQGLVAWDAQPASCDAALLAETHLLQRNLASCSIKDWLWGLPDC